LKNKGYIFRASTFQNFQNHPHNHTVGNTEYGNILPPEVSI